MEIVLYNIYTDVYTAKGVFFMVTAKVFQSGNSQAIRIPNEYRTEQTEFIIHKLGERFYLIPTSDPWCFLRGSLGADASAPFAASETCVSVFHPFLGPAFTAAIRLLMVIPSV